MTGYFIILPGPDGKPNRRRALLSGADNPFTGGTQQGPTSATPWLPFDMPTRDVLVASPYKCYPHYFPFYPLSISNKAFGQDYYDAVWMPPGTVEGTSDHRVYGGLLRDRPGTADRPVSPATATVNLGGAVAMSTPRWKVNDRRTEIDQAAAAGFDGFFVNIMGGNLDSNASNYQNYRYSLETWLAAQERWDGGDQTFPLLCQPDGSTSSTRTVAQAAQDLAWLAQNRSVTYRDPSSKKLLIAPYGPEFAPSNAKNDSTFWTSVQSTLQSTYGVASTFWPVFSASWPTAAAGTNGLGPAQMAPYSIGVSRWGIRNPVDNASTSSGARGAAAWAWSNVGLPYMPPVSSEDERARGGSFRESRNSENLRMTWLYAIEQQATGHAPQVILPTWNDYSENAHICPSVANGYSLLDISSYYLVRYKTGSYPTITRACIYLSHRVQPLAATYTYNPLNPDGTPIYTRFMSRVEGTPEVDQIEALTFLPEQATVQVKVNGTVVKSQVCPPGVTPVIAPLGVGTVSATATSTATGKVIAQVTSPYTVSATQQVQDLKYRYTSSLRG